MNSIIIHASRSRIFLILLGSIAFVGAGAWMLTLPSTEIGIKGTIAAWLGVPFFGTTGAFALTRLFSTRPALTIDRNGVTDNASGLSAGFIPWSDIAGAGIVTFQKQKFLGISLKDPQKYLVKVSFFKRLLMRTNSSWVGYVVNIPQVTLPVPVEELLAHIERYSQLAKDQPHA